MKKYFNYFTLDVTKKLAEECSHSGSCDADVQRVSELPEIKRQLKKINKDDLVKELREYGAWGDEELKDHTQNIQRILWIACGDIVEGNL